MGVNLGRRLACLSAAALVLSACAARQSGSETGSKIEQAPRRPGREVLLVVMPHHSESTKDVWTALQEELGEDFDLVPEITDQDSSEARLKKVITENDPVCIVLMDNTSVRLYQQYQSKAPKGTTFPPSLVLLSSFLDEAELKGLKNASGIAYEVPAVTAAMNMRTFLSRPIDRVGVVHRAPLRGFVEAQRKLAGVEHVSLMSQEIGDHPSPQDVRDAVEELVKNNRVDALWVLNDNQLLTKDLIQRAWIPSFKRADIPVIVGIQALVSSRVSFGTFAMVPDHSALGVQAADLVYELLEVESVQHRVDLPVSVKIAVDVKRARRAFGLDPEMLERIDYLVE